MEVFQGVGYEPLHFRFTTTRRLHDSTRRQYKLHERKWTEVSADIEGYPQLSHYPLIARYLLPSKIVTASRINYSIQWPPVPKKSFLVKYGSCSYTPRSPQIIDTPTYHMSKFSSMFGLKRFIDAKSAFWQVKVRLGASLLNWAQPGQGCQRCVSVSLGFTECKIWGMICFCSYSSNSVQDVPNAMKKHKT